MRKLIALGITFLLIVGGSPSFSASPKVGTACKKTNKFYESQSDFLVCSKTQGKKVWRKATKVEKSLYLKEKKRLVNEAAQKIIDDASAEAARILREVKAAADKAAADKAAADKAAADKAAADKAAADKAAADKAAADKAAADIPNLIAGRFFSGPDLDDSSWKWVAVEIRNSSPYNILSHRSYDVLIGDSGGAIVDSSWETSFPLLLPNQSAWYVTTQFNAQNSSQAVFRKTYSTPLSPLAASEFPGVINPRLVTSSYNSSRKAVGFTLKNNANSVILGSSSKAFAVVFNSSGVPIYAEYGFIGKSVLPGGQTEITVGDFTFNGEYSYILVTIGVNVG
jgi:nucleoid-associated protein YgaU